MTRTLVALLIAFVTNYAPLAHAEVKVGAARFAETVTVDGTSLQLNGAGIRTKVILNIYAMGLYLPQPAKTADAALASPPPRQIRIQLLRALSGATFADALIDGLKQNQPAEALAPFQSSIDALRQAIAAHSEFPENSIVLITEEKNGAVQIVINDKPMLAPITQSGFFSLLLSIWLGSNPVQESLKNALLQGSAS